MVSTLQKGVHEHTKCGCSRGLNRDRLLPLLYLETSQHVMTASETNKIIVLLNVYYQSVTKGKHYVNIGDVLEAFEKNKNTPIGRGTVVGVDNAKKRVELSDIEFLDANGPNVFKNRGSKKGLNRIYSVASGNGKLQGWKKLD